MYLFKRIRALGAAIIFAVMLCGLSGCVTTPQRQAYNRDANASIKHIDVLPSRESELHVFIVGNPGYNFGLIGALVAEANLAPKNDWLRHVAQRENFDHDATFRDRLTADFAARGYQLHWPTPAVDDRKAGAARDRWGLRKHYDPDDAADAQLDVNFGFVGYAAAGASDSSPYRPTVVVTARLVSSDGKQVLMSDQVVYNEVFPTGAKSITLNSDPGYAYPDFDALRAADTKAVAGLRIAFQSVADELARQF